MQIDAIVIGDFDVASNSGLTSGTPMLRSMSLRSMLRPLPTRVLAVLVAALLVAPATLLLAQKNSHRHERKHMEHEQIVALEREWQTAALAGDTTAMDKLLSEDYLGITPTGEVLTKAQQLDHMRDGKLLITKLNTSELKIKLVGNIAIVTSLAQVEGTSDGDPLHGAFRYTRVYQRLPTGVWKITNFEATATTHLHALPSPPSTQPSPQSTLPSPPS